MVFWNLFNIVFNVVMLVVNVVVEGMLLFWWVWMKLIVKSENNMFVKKVFIYDKCNVFRDDSLGLI